MRRSRVETWKLLVVSNTFVLPPYIMGLRLDVTRNAHLNLRYFKRSSVGLVGLF